MIKKRHDNIFINCIISYKSNNKTTAYQLTKKVINKLSNFQLIFSLQIFNFQQWSIQVLLSKTPDLPRSTTTKSSFAMKKPLKMSSCTLSHSPTLQNFFLSNSDRRSYSVSKRSGGFSGSGSSMCVINSPLFYGIHRSSPSLFKPFTE